MSKPLAFTALAQFAAATAGRNMTKAAYVAVATGVMMIVILTVDPLYEAMHYWVDALLWACLAFFVFEWLTRLRHASAGLALLVKRATPRSTICWTMPSSG